MITKVMDRMGLGKAADPSGIFVEMVGPELFYKLIYEPSYCNFSENRKKSIFYPPTQNDFCFVDFF